MKETEMIAHINKILEGFKATKVLDDGKFFIVDWRNSDGNGNLSARFYLDIENGTFIVTGDSGESVACWFNRVTPKQLKGYLGNVSYYIKKLQCTSDKYTYEYKDICEDLDVLQKEYIECAKEDGEDDEKLEEIREDFDELKEYFCQYAGHDVFPECMTDIMEKCTCCRRQSFRGFDQDLDIECRKSTGCGYGFRYPKRKAQPHPQGH